MDPTDPKPILCAGEVETCGTSVLLLAEVFTSSM